MAAWTSEGPGVMSAYWKPPLAGLPAILVLVPVLLVVGAVLTVAVALLLGPLLDFIGANLPWAASCWRQPRSSWSPSRSRS